MDVRFCLRMSKSEITPLRFKSHSEMAGAKVLIKSNTKR